MSSKSNALPANRALADVAADEDTLFDDSFVNGVAGFIKECATPMTIAIQGGWGSGKTSLVGLVEKKLRAKADSAQDDESDEVRYCEDIIGVASIDAWQQIVANPQVVLRESLMTEVVLRLAGTDRETMKSVSTFASLASQVLGAAIDQNDDSGKESKDSSPLASVLDSLFGEEEDSTSKSENENVSAEDISALRHEFTQTLTQVAQAAGKTENSRFVVFVDGLDQINPEAAVDFMEQIKIYLDCPGCVFVLAVDESLVNDGVRKRLGDKADEARKKMFFDRLVQVPLHIPAHAYKLDKYVEDLLKDERELSGEFVEVIDTLVKNPVPRCIKRYINTMHLCRNIFGVPNEAEDGSLPMLLAAVILQVESAQGFGAVADCADGDEECFDENLKAALEPLNLSDGIRWAMLPALWRGGEAGSVDAAKRSAFLSWVRKLK